ncbi:Major facilitator superfamily transporter [Metarhizium guizhouense ARSEF 977]|uniref:Major facilitator superfamily transporter n=1 Tax=Metarhizium guizhouense (strain ARSEF 977) TaxID=1276136 RepID=A0A0B4GJ36_METGA|nr:Major facilitator superfamily transporter [Metarhizium guizhouense ARSEF 977]
MAAKNPPGTVQLTGPDTKIILHPKPTDDYDDPLNWSTRRKTLHFGIVIWYTSATFLLLEAPHVSYTSLQADFAISDNELALERSLNFVSLGLTGIILIPLAYRYGRRPMYLMSSLLQVLASLWIANISTKYEYFMSSIIAGAAASVSQTLVPMTITDLFFMHQFATMNGMYLFAQGTGAFLAPIMAGFIIELGGWRWAFRWIAAVLGVTFLLIFILLEESTFVPSPPGGDVEVELDDENFFFHRPVSWISATEPVDLVDINRTMTISTTKAIQLPPPPKTWKQRFALITKTKRPIKKRFITPFIIIISFPAITYAAITYGSVMAWLSIYQHVTAVKLFQTPYNFSSFNMGIFGLAPFIGHTLGSVVVSALNDRWIVYLAHKNGGIYHPEMRLWLAIPGAILTCAGIIIYGIAIAKVASLPIIGLGFGLFGLGFSICLDVALAYITDCYHNMIGDALVGITFIRNLIGAVLGFAMIPWIRGMGILNTFIVVAATAAIVLLIPVPMIIWGKKARAATAAKYEHYSLAAIPPASLKKLMEDWS